MDWRVDRRMFPLGTFGRLEEETFRLGRLELSSEIDGVLGDNIAEDMV